MKKYFSMGFFLSSSRDSGESIGKVFRAVCVRKTCQLTLLAIFSFRSHLRFDNDISPSQNFLKRFLEVLGRWYMSEFYKSPFLDILDYARLNLQNEILVVQPFMMRVHGPVNTLPHLAGSPTKRPLSGSVNDTSKTSRCVWLGFLFWEAFLSWWEASWSEFRTFWQFRSLVTHLARSRAAYLEIRFRFLPLPILPGPCIDLKTFQ